MKTSIQLRRAIMERRAVVVPGCHDALSAMVVESAGFEAIQVSGFGIAGSLLGKPDVGLVQMKDVLDVTWNVVQAVGIPVMADVDTGGGNAINAAAITERLIAMGAAGMNVEDQVFPKRCGHTPGRRVVAIEDMVRKIKVAAASRSSRDFLIVARTDARTQHGLDEALRRGELYLEAGADGLFIEAPESPEELAKVGRTFQGVPQIANIVEGGGQTPVLPPEELYRLGFKMITYPCTVLFKVARTIETALADLKAGRPAASADMVDFAAFKDIVGYQDWATIDDTYRPAPQAKPS